MQVVERVVEKLQCQDVRRPGPFRSVAVGPSLVGSGAIQIIRDAAFADECWRAFSSVQGAPRIADVGELPLIMRFNFFPPVQGLAREGVDCGWVHEGLGRQGRDVIPVRGIHRPVWRLFRKSAPQQTRERIELGKDQPVIPNHPDLLCNLVEKWCHVIIFQIHFATIDRLEEIFTERLNTLVRPAIGPCLFKWVLRPWKPTINIVGIDLPVFCHDRGHMFQ